ncbi:formin-like protein 6 [Oxyura jamaicensis]|uniref:formin-like protein 6 n=1 Tax=Oxyura jamaicensis TaxID=8884 RepID=UPI0015A6EC66|nr:formin-like protein 6 [Oxyura jamaicensis]
MVNNGSTVSEGHHGCKGSTPVFQGHALLNINSANNLGTRDCDLELLSGAASCDAAHTSFDAECPHRGFRTLPAGTPRPEVPRLRALGGCGCSPPQEAARPRRPPAADLREPPRAPDACALPPAVPPAGTGPPQRVARCSPPGLCLLRLLPSPPPPPPPAAAAAAAVPSLAGSSCSHQILKGPLRSRNSFRCCSLLLLLLLPAPVEPPRTLQPGVSMHCQPAAAIASTARTPLAPRPEAAARGPFCRQEGPV